MKLIFRVNDRVRCPKNGDGIVLSTMTKSKVITGLYSAEVKVGFGPWTESYDNYAESSNKLSSLELITEEKSVSLKVGDSVRVLEKSSTNYMRVGTIIESGVIFDWRVYFSPCNTPWESFKSINLELITAEKSMKKSDLKSGMVTVNRKGDIAMVLIDSAAVGYNPDVLMYASASWGSLKDYNDNLLRRGDSLFDIMEVYKGSYVKPFQKDSLLWTREAPVQEMTLEEVCKQLGKNIKIIKG